MNRTFEVMADGDLFYVSERSATEEKRYGNFTTYDEASQLAIDLAIYTTGSTSVEVCDIPGISITTVAINDQ